jgi:hypothetical protein
VERECERCKELFDVEHSESKRKICDKCKSDTNSQFDKRQAVIPCNNGIGYKLVLSHNMTRTDDYGERRMVKVDPRVED